MMEVYGLKYDGSVWIGTWSVWIGTWSYGLKDEVMDINIEEVYTLKYHRNVWIKLWRKCMD